MRADPYNARKTPWFPWLVAALIVAALIYQVPRDALGVAVRDGAYLLLAVYVVVETLTLWPLDVFATRTALAIVDVRRGFSELFFLRGATYLLGVLSYTAAQGGVGVYLARSGVRAGRAAGALLFLIVSNAVVLIAIATLGLLADVPSARREILLMVLFGALASLIAYLTLIAIGPRVLTRQPVLAPLFDARVGGHLRAAAARLPHLLLMVGLQWGAYRVWGIPIPFWHSLALLTVILLVAALPITPNGLGTSQVLQVLFFSPWAVGSDAAAQQAEVLAFSLAHSVFGMLCQAAAGTVCLAQLRRARDRADIAPESSKELEVVA